MDVYSATRLGQQIHAERVQASERPIYPYEEYQGAGRRPAARQATAGWRDLLGRVANRRAPAWLRS